MSLPEGTNSVISLASRTKRCTVAFVLFQSAPIASFLYSLFYSLLFTGTS